MSSRVRTEIKLLALLAYVPIRYVEILLNGSHTGYWVHSAIQGQQFIYASG
uniref:Uncharacterized protein n=1 Tax=Escherichia coli TaxID=562 RepID=A0A6G9I3W5_ECOLX|nr:hypothetical protein [Escherichia coli]